MDDKHDFTYQREDTPENIEKSLDFLKAILRYKEDDRKMEDGSVCHFVFFNAEDLMKQLAFPLSLMDGMDSHLKSSYPWTEATLACNVTDNMFLTEAEELQTYVFLFSMTKVDAPEGSAKPLPLEEIAANSFIEEDGLRPIVYKGHRAVYIDPQFIHHALVSYSYLNRGEYPRSIESFYAIIDYDDEKVLLASEEYRSFYERLLCSWSDAQ